MGTQSCAEHLTTKIQDCIPDAENGAVTVKVIENPTHDNPCRHIIGFTDTGNRVFCDRSAEFEMTFHPKKEYHLSADKIIGRDDLRI